MKLARLKALSPYFIAFIGLSVSVVLFSPGHLDSDTSWQLEQAQTGIYDNWHPPFMAWLWGWGLNFLSGAWPMFLIINVGFWLGLSWTCFAFLPASPLAASLCTLVLGLWPTSLAVNALVWKDALFASLLILAFGTLMRWRNSRSAAFASLVFAAMAALVRHNGILGVAPFVAYWALRASPKHSIRAILAASGLIAILLAQRWVHSQSDHPGFPAQVLLTFDLAGISVESRKNLFPHGYKIDLDNLDQVYRHDSVLNLLWHSQEDSYLRPGFIENTEVKPEELKQTWVNAIKDNPSAYVMHRTMFVCSFMNFCKQYGRVFFEPGHPKAPSVLRHDGLATATVTWLQSLEETWVFDLRVYILILVVLGAGLILKPELAGEFRDEVNIAFASGFMYWSGFIFVGVASDFRYAWWSCLISLACAAPLTVRCWRARGFASALHFGREKPVKEKLA